MLRTLPVFLLLLCKGLLFAQADPRQACAADVQKICPNVPQGGGRVLACLKQHQDQVSAACKQSVLQALQIPRETGCLGRPSQPWS